MSNNKRKQGLNERLARKKRVQRMKTGIIVLIITWMLVCMLVSVTLVAKVRSLQRQLDILTESTIRSQQVEQQENKAANQEEDLEGYESSSDDMEAEETTETADSDVVQTMADSAETDDDEDVQKVYLTFDDGPSANTEKILDILDQYQVKATFFVIGKEDADSLQRYQEIVARGHTLGMHSYSHKYNVIYSSLDAFAEDLDQIRNLLKETTGVESHLYRFPGGSSNQVSNTDMSEFIRYLNQQGITYFDWNVQCGDATSHSYSVDELVQNVMNDVVKFRTSVVLMHDAEDKPNTVEALPIIIEQLQAMDAKILPIDDTTRLVQHVSADSVGD